jgi:hypothetical protein
MRAGFLYVDFDENGTIKGVKSLQKKDIVKCLKDLVIKG